MKNYQDYEFTRLNTYEKKEMSEEFPKIGSNNNYWIKLSSIIGNYRPRKTSRLRRKEETSLYKIILCGCLIIQICFTTEPRSGLMTDSG